MERRVIERNSEMFLGGQVLTILYLDPVDELYHVKKEWDNSLLFEEVYSDLDLARSVYKKELWRPVTTAEVLN